jgi:hypothetical protein
MVRAGDKMPPAYVIKRSGRYTVIDGNRRLEVAVANGLTHMDAYIPLGKTEELEKGQVDINHNSNLPPAGMLATSTGGFQNFDYGMDKSDLMPGGLADNMHPEDFDQEQLAIGTQHEMEHTDDQELAREIAMDHLTEDPNYYKQEEEPLNKMALIHNNPQQPMTVYRGPEGASEWFGEEKQVMFIPHESETKLQMAKSDWSMEKAISDLPVGRKLSKPSGNQLKNNTGRAIGYDDTSYYKWKPVGSWDYSHLLTPEQRKNGYSIRVDKAENAINGDGSDSADHKQILISGCFYNNKRVGNVFGRIWKHTYRNSIEPHSELNTVHRGKGLGVKMYEALYSHAKNVEGLARAIGGMHSEDAHRVHLSLAKRHGISYKPKKSDSESYPYGDYRYALKGEIPGTEPLDESNLGNIHFIKQELEKAISDLPVGKKLTRTPKDISYNSGDLAGYSTDDYVPTESYDYSHLLTTEQKNAGYSLRVDKASNNKNEVLVCRALHGKKKVGDVFGMVWNKGDHKDIEPHSCIYSEKHQGKGLGIKMYEALYSHAKHIENISGVSGKEHSEAARRVHLSLAKRHGLNYQSGISRKYTPPVYAPYSYELKAEIPSTEQLDESDLDTVRFIKEELKEELDPAKSPPTETVLDKEAISEHIKSIRAHHKLVPGEVLDSRHIVVQNASGKNAIRQVAAGMQRDLNENVGNPIGPSMGNPTSTRNKPSRI